MAVCCVPGNRITIFVILYVRWTKRFDPHRMPICPEFKLLIDPLNLTDYCFYVVTIISHLSKIGVQVEEKAFQLVAEFAFVGVCEGVFSYSAGS